MRIVTPEKFLHQCAVKLHKSTYPAGAASSKSAVFFSILLAFTIYAIELIRKNSRSACLLFYGILKHVSRSSRILVVCLMVQSKKWPLLFLGWRDNSPQHKNNSLVKLSLPNFTLAFSRICVWLLFKTVPLLWEPPENRQIEGLSCFVETIVFWFDWVFEKM